MTPARAMIFAMALCLASEANAGPQEINVGALINRVIAGENFVGKELILSGVVLDGGSSGSGLINLATQETYRSLTHDNFVSIYESNVVLQKGSPARIRVQVEESSGHRLDGKSFVIISTVFRECLGCKE